VAVPATSDHVVEGIASAGTEGDDVIGDGGEVGTAGIVAIDAKDIPGEDVFAAELVGGAVPALGGGAAVRVDVPEVAGGVKRARVPMGAAGDGARGAGSRRHQGDLFIL
jgi:hypothetical protein